MIEISTDGGCACNPGPGGAGVFIELKDKAGITTEEVSIHFSIVRTTNNRAELEAARIALEYIEEHGITETILNLDSAYVLNPMLKGWLSTWKSNNWTTSTGAPIKNEDLWIPFEELYTRVSGACKLHLKWVKGHSGHYGNEHADDLATIGKVLAESGIEEYREVSNKKLTAEGLPVKETKFKMSPLLQSSRLYFQSREKLRKDELGRCIYYTGTHGKDDGDVGKRTHEAQHCVTLLNESDPVLDFIVEEHQRVNHRKLGTVATIKIDTACTAVKYSKLRNILADPDSDKERIFMPMTSKDGLKESQGLLISRDIAPPILGFTCLDTFYALEQILRGYLDGSAIVQATDLTDVLYDVGVVGKGDKERAKYSLKKDITTSTKVLDLLISIPDDNKQIKLTLGHCLPTRNTLSAISKFSPKVTAITWTEGGKSFRLAFILETTEGASLWTSFYSALYFTD